MEEQIKIVECPRDAMQGIDGFIPTAKKVAYLNRLLAPGFDTLDFGSFVSPKAVPQMQDTREIVPQLKLAGTATKLLAIVANLRGARDAVQFAEISYLGYPMSVSETFQQKNTNKSISQSLDDLAAISDLCQQHNKELVVYISMGFGNPYGDPYNADIVARFADVLVTLGATTISLADTVGLATPQEVEQLFVRVKAVSDTVTWGVHLHATATDAADKVKAALHGGCYRLDGAILGYGGCPLAGNDLVGNINTRTILEVADELGLATGIDRQAFAEAEAMAATVFK